MLTKIKSISFTQLKQIRKKYLTLISHSETLQQINNTMGVVKVLDHLETEYKAYRTSQNDIKALFYIIHNFDFLQYKLTCY